MASEQTDRKSWIIEKTLFVFALSAITGLALIAAFILREGLPVVLDHGLRNFLFSTDWSPGEKHYGILTMIAGSAAVMFGALLFGVPVGLSCAIAISEFCHKRVAHVLKAMIELLAGIPSVVFGFIGVIVLVSLIRENIGGPGMSVLAASIVLGVMILPSVVSISVDAMRAVPDSYRQGSIALGATRWQTTRRVVLRAARSGIVTAVILGMGRAIGETMAVIMVTGNAVQVPGSPLDSVRTMTSNIALELNYSAGEHRKALFATGVVLFIMIMILNTVATWASKRRAAR